MLTGKVYLSSDAYFCGGNNKMRDMIIARSSFSVCRTVRTFIETYQKLEMECGSERRYHDSLQIEKPELIEKIRIAATVAGVAIAEELYLST